MKTRWSIDPVTGCAHIVNAHAYYGIYRGCSHCLAKVPEGEAEEGVNYCWNCGNTFDHMDDEPKENEECGRYSDTQDQNGA